MVQKLVRFIGRMKEIPSVHQVIRAEVAPRFIYGDKAQANLFAVKFLFGFECTF